MELTGNHRNQINYAFRILTQAIQHHADGVEDSIVANAEALRLAFQILPSASQDPLPPRDEPLYRPVPEPAQAPQPAHPAEPPRPDPTVAMLLNIIHLQQQQPRQITAALPKLDSYEGDTDLSIFKNRFSSYSREYGWTPIDEAAKISLFLKGKAANIYDRLTIEQRNSIDTVWSVFEKNFSQTRITRILGDNPKHPRF